MSTQNVNTIEAQPASQSYLAIVSLIAGIAGWSIFPVLGGFIAVVTGHLAINEIRTSEGRLSGKNLALAGLILGYTCLVITALIILVLILGFFYFNIFNVVF